ncbi:MAG: type II secretion system F family protein [Lachnospiraceae bacterium]|nr:type II secretion system F family protein [Lachnospiraceae bacterium]
MAAYAYNAIDKTGKSKRGTIDAVSVDRAMAALKAEGLTPLKVQEASVFNQEVTIGGKKTSDKDLALFCNQFASILTAGVPAVEALGMLAEQTENKQFAKAINETKVNIERGESLGNAMAMRRDIYPPMLVSMVRAGEASGSLETSLTRMGTQFEKDTQLKNTIKKALTYPAIVFIVMIAVIILLLVKVIPTFMNIFKDMDVEMPKLTMAVVAVSDGFKKYWYIIAAVVILVVIAWKVFAASMTGKVLLGKFTLWCPLTKNFVVKTGSARLARTLSTLSSAGLSIVESLEIVSKTMSNIIMKMAVVDAKEEVKKGMPLSEPLRRSGVFPAMMIHMTKIGESTGDMDGMLTKMAEYYEEEVELATQQLLAMLEPMITIVMAGMVALVIAAVFGPMLALYDGLDKL